MNINHIGKELFIESWDDDIEYIDISLHYLHKIPNLSRFTKLKTLDCSNNQIMIIDNLPESLETLICSNNKISHIDNLPLTLKNLDCSNNNIKKLNNLPISLNIFKMLNNNEKILYETQYSLQFDDIYARNLINFDNLPAFLEDLNLNTNSIFDDITESTTVKNKKMTFISNKFIKKEKYACKNSRLYNHYINNLIYRNFENIRIKNLPCSLILYNSISIHIYPFKINLAIKLWFSWAILDLIKIFCHCIFCFMIGRIMHYMKKLQRKLFSLFR